MPRTARVMKGAADAVALLTRGFAHEARNPLFAITANLDLIEAQPLAPQEQREAIAWMRRDATRLNQLVAELVAYGDGGGDAGTARLRPTAEQAIADAVAAQGLPAERVDFAPARSLPPGAVDARLGRALRHVIENALWRSPADARIRVELGRGRARGRDCVVVTVTDHGPRVPASDIPKLFDPYFAKRCGGRGLGMATAAHLASRSGARISAASADDAGLVVRMLWPLAEDAR